MATPYRQTHPLRAEIFQHVAAMHEMDCKTELYDGMIVVQEPQGYDSADVGATILILLGSYVRDQGIGRVLGEGGTFVVKRNPDSVYVPDVSFIPNDRIPYAGARKKFVEGAPPLAVEVMSPGDRFTAIQRKAYVYLANGTQLVWIVRPKDRTVVIHRAGSTEVRILQATDIIDGEDIIPGFQCSVAEFFT